MILLIIAFLPGRESQWLIPIKLTLAQGMMLSIRAYVPLADVSIPVVKRETSCSDRKSDLVQGCEMPFFQAIEPAESEGWRAKDLSC